MRTSGAPLWSGARWVGLALAPLLALLALGALGAPVSFAAPAHAAHAYYVRSTPAANAVVKSAPSQVTITFAEPVTPGGSGVVIYDAKNQVVSGAAHIDQNDLATLDVPMTGDGSEVYLVVWHTVSAQDGDPDVGAFSFFVNASGASDLAPKPSAATPGPASQGGAPVWLVALIGVIGLVVGAGGGMVWAQRQPRRQPIGATTESVGSAEQER